MGFRLGETQLTVAGVMANTLPLDRWPEFRRLHDYLAKKAPPGKLPGRQHVDPLDLPDLLPRIMLMDVVRDAGDRRRYRIRLMGSDVAALQGEDGTGKFIEEVVTGGPEIIAAYDEIVQSRQPQYRHGHVMAVGRDFISYERIAFPLASDGENIDMLLFIFVTQPAPGGRE